MGADKTINTAEELRAAYPELVAQIEKAAQAQGETAGAASERARIQGIEEIAGAIADPEMLNNAKFGEKPLTAQEISSTYLELNQLYFGPDMVSDQEIALEWSRIPHFYTPFYVYQYATGFSAAIALSNKILEEGAPAVERYKTFLKGGSSMDPIDLLKTAGVDMTTSQPVQAALDVFGSLVDQMEEMIQ